MPAEKHVLRRALAPLWEKNTQISSDGGLQGKGTWLTSPEDVRLASARAENYQHRSWEPGRINMYNVIATAAVGLDQPVASQRSWEGWHYLQDTHCTHENTKGQREKQPA